MITQPYGTALHHMIPETRGIPNGHEILETMTECHLIIANGRTVGDLYGTLIYDGMSASSGRDPVITSPAMRENTRYFKVCNAVPFTEHCPIALYLEIGKNVSLITWLKTLSQSLNPNGKPVVMINCARP